MYDTPSVTPNPINFIRCPCGLEYPGGTGETVCSRCNMAIADRWSRFEFKIINGDDPLDDLGDPFQDVPLTKIERTNKVAELLLSDVRYLAPAAYAMATHPLAQSLLRESI